MSPMQSMMVGIILGRMQATHLQETSTESTSIDFGDADSWDFNRRPSQRHQLSRLETPSFGREVNGHVVQLRALAVQQSLRVASGIKIWVVPEDTMVNIPVVEAPDCGGKLRDWLCSHGAPYAADVEVCWCCQRGLKA